MIPLFEQSGSGLWESLAFAAMGAACAFFILSRRIRRRPDHAMAAPSIAIALAVAALAFIPVEYWRLSSLAAGVMAAGLIFVLRSWKRPDKKNACTRDMEKMARWGNDKK